jgi:phenylalanyl-tRNA synthetase beta chain
MLAVGQPTHAFDSDNIAGHITVRPAAEDEKLLLLNGRELTLSQNDLVIADDEDSVGLAGIMGGAKDSVLPTTDKVILELANFEAIGIRRTTQKYDARTEASIRYEKGVDPQRADDALSLAMSMFADEFPGMAVTGFHDNYPKPLAKTEVDVALDWLAARLGKRLDNAEIRRILERLGFAVRFSPSGGEMHVVSPTWRSTGDVKFPDDIMEEVARMHGYENFGATPITTAFDRAINQREIDVDRRIREYLSFRCGMQEIFTYPWVEDELLDEVSFDRAGALEILTQPSPHERFIRPSLLPNLFRAVSGNARFLDSFAIYESAQVFAGGEFVSAYDPREKLPPQRRSVAGALVGDPGRVKELFRAANGIIEGMPKFAHIHSLDFEQTSRPRWADDVVWLNVVSSGAAVGVLALLSKKSAIAFGIKIPAVMAFELDIDALKPLESRTNKYERLPEYPRTEYDISMLFDESVKWRDVLGTATAKKGPSDMVRSVAFVDEYRGKQVPEGKKSITLRLVIGSDSKTLTSAEIESSAGMIVKRLKKGLGGELRG